MRDRLPMLLFAVALGLACGALVTTVAQGTRVRRELNQRRAEMRQLLEAVGVKVSPAATNEEITQVYKDHFPAGEVTYGSVGVLEEWEGGRLKAVALHFAGRGMWGPIEGYLVLEPNGRTVWALAVTEHHETPGLGAQIAENPGFLRQWRNRVVVTDDGRLGIDMVRPGAIAALNEVHAITGATRSCKGLEKAIDDAMVAFHAERNRRGR